MWGTFISLSQNTTNSHWQIILGVRDWKTRATASANGGQGVSCLVPPCKTSRSFHTIEKHRFAPFPDDFFWEHHRFALGLLFPTPAADARDLARGHPPRDAWRQASVPMVSAQYGPPDPPLKHGMVHVFINRPANFGGTPIYGNPQLRIWILSII